MAKFVNNLSVFTQRFQLELLAFVALAIVTAVVVLPLSVGAEPDGIDERRVQLEIAAMQNAFKDYGVLPENPYREADTFMKNIPVTAYNSVVWQTDSTPCIGASGENICDLYAQGQDVCAANFVPLGTILEVEGLGNCVVRDRMNARYFYRVDWFMGVDVQAAKQFGVRYRDVGILSY